MNANMVLNMYYFFKLRRQSCKDVGTDFSLHIDPVPYFDISDLFSVIPGFLISVFPSFLVLAQPGTDRKYTSSFSI